MSSIVDPHTVTSPPAQRSPSGGWGDRLCEFRNAAVTGGYWAAIGGGAVSLAMTAAGAGATLIGSVTNPATPALTVATTALGSLAASFVSAAGISVIGKTRAMIATARPTARRLGVAFGLATGLAMTGAGGFVGYKIATVSPATNDATPSDHKKSTCERILEGAAKTGAKVTCP